MRRPSTKSEETIKTETHLVSTCALGAFRITEKKEYQKGRPRLIWVAYALRQTKRKLDGFLRVDAMKKYDFLFGAKWLVGAPSKNEGNKCNDR